MKDKGPVFIDTNILVYNVYGSPEQKAATAALLTEQSAIPLISTQVLKEFANASLKRKLNKTTEELKLHLVKIKQTFTVLEIRAETILDALDLKDQYKYSFYDSLIIASALENKCSTLYSEDLQHGQLIRKKLKIVNPFK